MRISAVRCFVVEGPAEIPAQEERQVGMLDIYPHFAVRPPAGARHHLEAAYVQVEEAGGAYGLFGPIFPEVIPLIHSKLAPLIVGQDPRAGEYLWDVMYRSDRHARKGYLMMAISAVDCAIWDLRGKLAGAPVWRLLGGPTRPAVPAYASMLGSSHEPARIAAREASPVDAVQASLDRIEQVNPRLNCFCFTFPERALAEARALEAEAPRGPLHGVPIAIKDLTPTKGDRTTLGSFSHEHHVPDHDSVIVERLRAAGAIVVGKTTTPEFAYSSFTRSPLWGPTRNPWNTELNPGGSSGGSAAAVASGCVPLAEGTDMGGSVRIPASYCGIVGHKPSFGRIPLDVVPSSWDTIHHFGPLARTIDDARLFLRATAGVDDRDALSMTETMDFSQPIAGDATGLPSLPSSNEPSMRVRRELVGDSSTCLPAPQSPGCS